MEKRSSIGKGNSTKKSYNRQNWYNGKAFRNYSDSDTFSNAEHRFGYNKNSFTLNSSLFTGRHQKQLI